MAETHRAIDLCVVIRDAASELAVLLERDIDAEVAADRVLFDCLAAANACAPVIVAEIAAGFLLPRYGAEDYERRLRTARRRWEGRDVEFPF